MVRVESAKNANLLTPPPSKSPDFPAFIERNWDSLKYDYGDSALRRYWKRVNRQYRGRGGRYKKLTVFSLWLYSLLDSISGGIDPYDGLRKTCSDRTLTRRSRLDKPNPEFDSEFEQAAKLDSAEARMGHYTWLPLLSFESWLSEIDGNWDREKIREFLLSVKAENNLMRRIFAYLKKQPLMTQRELSRKLNKKAEEFYPALECLARERIILWDREKKSIQLYGFNPKDGRHFVWKRDSCWPRFGPRLEKGKSYSVSDFKLDVVNTWVQQGAAEFC